MDKNRLRFEDEDPGNSSPDGDTASTSGQNVQKSGGKLKQDTEKARFSEKLQHSTVPEKMEVESDKLNKSKLRMEKSGNKLEMTKEALATKKPIKKPGAIKSIAGAARVKAWLYTHSKIYQVENENVGIKAAHRTELAGEAVARGGVRHVKKMIRNQPERRVRTLERKNIRARADYTYRTMVTENPQLRKNAAARYMQKRQLRKMYQKQARETAKKTAKTTAKATRRTAIVAVKTVKALKHIGKAIVLFVAAHPKITLVILGFMLLIVILQSCFSSALTISNSMGGAFFVSTYQSEDSQMLAAEAAYAALEAALQYQLDNFEALNPGYDEYHYELDEIWHDPYVLISILSAIHAGAWTLDEMHGVIAMLFDLQYTLTTTVQVELRTRTVTETITDPVTGEEYTVNYTEQYYYRICYVTLENFNLSHLPVYIMDEECLSRYAVYMATLGNRPDLFPKSEYPHASTIEDYERYTIPPEYMGDARFAAMIREAEKYLGWPYVWGGSSPATSFDCSGYVSWVINQTGWNVGRLGARGLYNICTPVSPANARPGDLIFFNYTYNAPQPHLPTHVGIYVGDGMMIHCGNPISYASINTPYWQRHFYGFGRLP